MPIQAFRILPSFGIAQAREQLQDLEQRQVLIETYHWLTQRAAKEGRYRKRLTEFIDTALLDRELQQSPFARDAGAVRLDRIETLMAGLGRGLEQVQPEEIIKEGAGELHAQWEKDDALLSWQKTFDRPIGLRDASSQAFSVYGEFPMQTAACLADALVQNVRATHSVLPPNFEFPVGLEKGVAPKYWKWTRSRRGKDRAVLPDWIENNEQTALPNPVELYLFLHQRELAELLDELLVAAALRDAEDHSYDTPPEGAKQRQTPSAVEQLIEITAFVADRPKAEMAEFFNQSLRRRQARPSSSGEYAANTEALRFLWSQLAETA